MHECKSLYKLIISLSFQDKCVNKFWVLKLLIFISDFVQKYNLRKMYSINYKNFIFTKKDNVRLNLQ